MTLEPATLGSKFNSKRDIPPAFVGGGNVLSDDAIFQLIAEV